MEHDHGDSLDWSMERRVEGLVNKHMADIAVESLQQRLTAVSDEMHSLVEHVSRRSETAAQRKIIALLVEIKDEQQRQWAVLRDLQARLQGQTGYEEEDVEALDMDLPLRTLEQLDEMERRLEEPGIQKKMVSFLSRMGGATIDDAVRRLMQAVLSFAVGSELNWVGRGQKRSFRNTRLQGVLFRALKRTPVGKEATHHQYADVVKKWLRFAPFRQGGSGRRCCKPPVESPDSEEVDSFNQSCTH
ncbi:uncharacterized protein LOC111239220 isoform X2 [Seriola dumerili]|uniref:uncharacterized protein LOC111239220 isoform X2 n=1 Tax=Seriola dumerili TaxID=41447 RepID=UPI000BBEC46C|nr:uncharacterized protein LOC111239220 isoform X2 [Seriola dumerili]